MSGGVGKRACGNKEVASPFPASPKGKSRRGEGSPGAGRHPLPHKRAAGPLCILRHEYPEIRRGGGSADVIQ